MLIQILYNKIQDKSKVLTSEKVVTVQNGYSHVTVTTKTGNSYTGDMVVGADGIHSTVRQQMWQNAQATDPTWIDASEKQCMYLILLLIIMSLPRWLMPLSSPPGNIRMYIRHIGGSLRR